MGGDTGGNDCVHVIDVRADGEVAEALELRQGYVMRPDTDVIVYDEHGNVCQFTYQEWTDHVEKVHAGDFDHIAPEYYSPEDIVPIKLDLSRVGPDATGVDPSALSRLEALPLTSVDISGTFETAEVRCTCQPLRPLDVPTRAETLKQFEAAGFTASEDGR